VAGGCTVALGHQSSESVIVGEDMPWAGFLVTIIISNGEHLFCAPTKRKQYQITGVGI